MLFTLGWSLLISVFIVVLVLKSTLVKKGHVSGQSRPKFTLYQTKTSQAEWFYLLKCHQFSCQCFTWRQQCKFFSKWLRNLLRKHTTFHQSWNDPIHCNCKYWKALVLTSSNKCKKNKIKDEYLKHIECTNDENHFFFRSVIITILLGKWMPIYKD